MNIHSMQEMNYNIIDKYFNYIRKSKYKDKILFYCCNRVKKTLFDGEELIFDDYPWKKMIKLFLMKLAQIGIKEHICQNHHFM